MLYLVFVFRLKESVLCVWKKNFAIFDTIADNAPVVPLRPSSSP